MAHLDNKRVTSFYEYTKVKVALEHAMKAQTGGRDTALPIHDLGDRRGNILKLTKKNVLLCNPYKPGITKALKVITKNGGT